MKKAKVVITNAAKKNRWTAKKTVLAAFCAVAALGAVSVVVPTSNIPGFKYIATLIGLNEDATRNLTMADFASYALGTKDNKIQELRASNLSYNGAGNYGGGLSPFATLSADRLAQAYEKNSQEAMEMEKALGGKIAPFDKNILDKDFAIDPNILGKGFDPTKLTGSSKAAYSGAMEALAAAAGQQAEAFGKPVKKEDLQNVANLVGLKDANISNIVGTGNILSLAKKDDLLYDRIMKNAKALSATSIFGSVNPEFNRTDTRIGRPVYGLFKDLGTAFFFSRYAVAAKMPTAAADIAIAAFDGGTPQSESIITEDETTEEPSISVDPEQELSSGASQVNACSEVSQAYNEAIIATSNAISGYLKTMEQLKQMEGVDISRSNVPGCCVPAGGINNASLRAKNKWNYFLTGYAIGHMGDNVPEVDKSLRELCDDLIEMRQMFQNQCGITFNTPEYSCAEMAKQLRLVGCGQKLMLGQPQPPCQNISIFADNDFDDDNINRNRWNQFNERVDFYMSQEDSNYTQDEAEELAALDVGFTGDDIEGSAYHICTSTIGCWQHINKVLEKTFDIKDIVDIRGLIMEQYKDSPYQLRNYDAQQIAACQNSGNMEDCQDIIDYYQDGVWEEQCSSVNTNLYKFIDPNTNRLRSNWTINKIRADYGVQVTDCIALYLATH